MNQQQKGNKRQQSFGARFRIQQPNFQFPESNQEDKFVEEIIDKHKEDTRILNEKVKNQTKLIMQNKSLDNSQGFLPKLNQSGEKNLSQEIELYNAQYKKQKIDPSKRRLMVSANINGQKKKGLNDRGRGLSLYQPGEEKQAVKQGLSSGVQQFQTQLLKIPSVQNHQIHLDHNMKIQENSHDLSSSWIESMQRPAQMKAIKKPARNLERIDHNLGTVQSLRNVRAYSSNQNSILDQTANGLNATQTVLQENIEFGEKIFPDFGYNSNKTLKNYDCWDEETTPQQWVEKCRKQKDKVHGKCPLFVNGQYLWTDVELLDYDSKSEKYIVRVIQSGIKKEVIRLSLLFRDENEEKFKERVEIAKLRQQTATDEMRFFKLVDSFSDDLVNQIKGVERGRIFKRLFVKSKEQSLYGGMDFTHYLSKLPQQRKNLVEKLFKEAEYDYQLYQKKDIVLKQMSDPLNDQKWISGRVSNRWVPKQLRFLGTIEKLDIHFIPTVEYLQKTQIQKNKLVKNVLQQINNRLKEFETFNLFKYEFETNSNNIQITSSQNSNPQQPHKSSLVSTQVQFQGNDPRANFQNNANNRIPLSLIEYEKQQQAFYLNAVKNFGIKVRDFLVNSIQDQLRLEYSFYITENSLYTGTELSKLLRLIDYRFNSYMRELVLFQNGTKYRDFLKQFTDPLYEKQENEISEQNGFRGVYQRSIGPLLEINLTVKEKKKKEKEKKKKPAANAKEEDDKDQEDQDQKGGDQQIFQFASLNGENLFQKGNYQSTFTIQDGENIIIFEPSFQQVCEGILRPLEGLVDFSKRVQKLEKELVPLLELERQSSLQLELDDSYITSLGTEIVSFLKEGYEEPLKILEKFRNYNFLYEKSTGHVLRHLFGEFNKENPQILNIDFEEVVAKLQEYYQAKKEIETLCLDEKKTKFFLVKTRAAKDALISRAQDFINQILVRLVEICSENTERISKNFDEIAKKLSVNPENEQQLVDLKLDIAENEVNLAHLHSEVFGVMKYLNLMENFQQKYPEEKYEYFWFLFSRPIEILEAVSDSARIAQIQEEKFQIVLEQQKDKFQKELKEYMGDFGSIKQMNDYKLVKECSTASYNLMEKIVNANQKVRDFNQREMIFKQLPSEYHDLNKLMTEFTPYHQLWSLAFEFDSEYQEWMGGPFLKTLNFSVLEKRVNSYFYKETTRLLKYFGDLEDQNACDVAQELKGNIEKFRENLWLIELLTTEAMINPKKSGPHWKELFKECEIVMEANDEMTLQRLLEVGILEHRIKIEDISRKADKQWALEKKLKEMEDKAKAQVIDLMAYKNTGTYVLKSLDEIQQLLDDQLNLLMMMKASPYIKPLLKQALVLEGKVILIQDTLEEMLKCQRNWMYLEPIFASDDIKKKMPSEQKMFEKVDISWRDLMALFFKESSIWENIDSEKIKHEFSNHNKTLDIIQKSLSEYLETKRRYFPRFYFLSDEELLEILADTKDPLKVQKHINKCFEAINLLHFNQQQQVMGMISAEKETVPFKNKIDVNEGERKGNVEIWLLEIERTMIETLQNITKECMMDLGTIRTNWVQKWPGQIVLAVNMQRWTIGSEASIQNQKAGQALIPDSFGNLHSSIKEFRQSLDNDLKDIVVLVRQEMTDLSRMTLGALVVLDVHAKDVILQLEERKCEDMTDFMWISQLRYYWEESKKEKIMHVKMINASIRYGFEYLGNSPRLVITPLTDRCYRTLMGAKHLQYGGAPEGPAGTGKTETVKDLAKALAVQCVVFNCSDGLNFLAMRKFFKGLASSGAWCCFDEFNRIDLEVLSVIAQQVLTIQTAVKEKKKVFQFDDEEISLISSCAINITMNPGYAGRSELPDNLKALFRPCAMMVPDYAMIAEIYLYSVGFQDARNLARKVVASLRLSSEQLSSQDHYDFGMRAVKSILTAAGNLKREMLDQLEDIVCLRSLMDVNLPKFTINDVPLFKSITSDLFPGVVMPEFDYGALMTSLIQTCNEQNLQPLETFLTKCIQLYDTINVRHGLMIVGAAFSGKSSILETLRGAMSRLKGVEKFVHTVTLKLNPKSVTSDQLYGKLDPDTKSWSDGVVAIIMRQSAQDGDNPERKWIVFDGPVDAVWIENMNTVLDDNKKLCLTSGEIIKMSNWMTMMFEVADLAVASPATVSRCGMVFLETQTLGWEPLIKSFVKKIPALILPYAESIYTHLKWIYNACFAWCQQNAKFLVHNSIMNFINSGINLLNTFFKPYNEENAKLPKEIEEIYKQMILFSTAWSLGSAMEEKSRKKFGEFILHLVSCDPEIPAKFKLEIYLEYPFEPMAIQHKIPENTSIFEVVFNPKTGLWPGWTQTVDKFVINKETEFHQLFVPTIDSIRNNYFLHKCVQNKMHLLICGQTGTGKTVNIINELNQHYFNAEYTNLCTSFSGQTKANQVQRLIESKVCSRRRKGYYGPEEGKRYIVIFIDDLNMPTKEVFGAQPPIELLRQWMDHGGFYDLDTKEWKYLQDITFISAMLPSGTQVTMRYLRHFYLLYVEPFEQDSLMRIFSNILDWFFSRQSFSKAITSLRDQAVLSTIQLYQNIQNSKELLPTPAKSHYIYNLRDISKVFQGIAKSTSKGVTTDVDFLRLWANECERVFKDRLISIEDRGYFDQMLHSIVHKNFKREWNDLVEFQPLMFASFIPCIYPDGDNSKKPYTDLYCEIQDRDLLQKKCYEYLNEYNNFYSGNRMNLVLFMSAIQHLLKVVRIITTSFGHALLVGVGGSGRKSLATLSSFIAFQTEPFICDQKMWTDEMQKLLKITGLEDKEAVFLFSDTQITNEGLVEDICNILNKGEIPNLFPPEEKAKILEDIPITGSPNEKYQYFVQQCKKNLHIVLAFSPVGESFRRRLRTFPTLINCSTIDWFLPWPEEALRSTASNHFVKEMKINDENLKNALVDVAVDMQVRITELSQRYLQELRRYYYVTPTSYLELLSTFQKLLSKRELDIQAQIKRYEQGVAKILDTENVVEKMQKELEDLKPLLIQKTKENLEMLGNLQIQQKDADQKREVCEGEEKICNVQRDQANALQADCKAELDKVVPLLIAASKALDNITKDDMNTLKSFVKPPESASLVLEGVCYALDEDKNVKWIPKPEGKPGEKIQDFWDYSKKKLLNDKLIKRIQEFREGEIRAIPEKNVEKLRVFVKQALFEKDKVFNASKAAGNLSLWVRAVVDTYYALLVVDPKRKQEAEAKAKLQIAEETLAEKKAALKQVMDLLDSLQAAYDKAKQEKETLEKKVQTCEEQLVRADKLISGLGGEKGAWTEKAANFRKSSTSTVGDSLISSGIIAYLGAFPIQYREETIEKWKELLLKVDIKFSPNFSLQNILSDPITIGQWTNSFKLPNDNFSIDNAIILKNSTRWPLMIDPQTQANTWVKRLEAVRGLKVIRPQESFNRLYNLLEAAITTGIPVLLENVSESIDQIFEPILQNKLVKQGSSYRLKFMDKFIDYSNEFRFYMTTKLPRPHYPPEVCVKVTLLNFQVTPLGLEDQMNNIVVQREEPIKDRQRQTNIEEFFLNKEKQRNTEDLILKLLNEASGNLLDDEQLIDTLGKSKIEGKEIEDALKKQEHFQEMFNGIRKHFNPIAQRIANLYFVILDLAMVEPTYQWSLEFYINLFDRSIEKAIPGKENRIINIINKFQQNLYDSICRSLLEKDKLIFSLLMCQKILEIQKKITPLQTRFMMVGGTWTEPTRAAPESSSLWLSKKAWCTLLELEQTLKEFEGFTKDFEINLSFWQKLTDSPSPFDQIWPDKWNSIHPYLKLIVIRILFPDKFSQAVTKLIINEMGASFVSPPPFDLELTTQDSTPFTPLIFILSPGADPRLEILNLADKKGFKSSFMQISLGQGQGEMAERSIKQALKEGRWVLLQNCHLAPSFMPDLERILETMDLEKDQVHPDFRIWLTSMPSEIFPPMILMKGIKMTFEPPRGLKNNLLRSFSSQDKKSFEDSQKPYQWKKLFFGLAFFHALILERRKFGPLGWNIPYEFTVPDFTISWSQLKMFLDEYDEIPWEALQYMVAEANYGGRVTDPKDRRLINVILKDFYSPKILDEHYKFSKSGTYYPLNEGELPHFMEYIENLPREEEIEVYCLHSNAQISSAIIETNQICDTILSLLPRTGGGGGKSAEEIIKEKSQILLKKLPANFDTDMVSKKHPVSYNESMNTVLQQELIRFNKLITVVRNSLINVAKAIDGLLVFSSDLEQVYGAIFDNKIPETWKKVSYPSMKPLGSYMNDLVERLSFMQKWVENGAPPAFWISGFYFTQSFLTGVMQNYSRKYKIPIDTLIFEFKVVDPEKHLHIDVSIAPSDGCYIHGLFFDGARWDKELECVNESQPKQLISAVPYIQLIPTDKKMDFTDQHKVYCCPVYKTSDRRGVLSTTGHSTNFVLDIYFPIHKETTSDHWVKRGLAALTQTND